MISRTYFFTFIIEEVETKEEHYYDGMITLKSLFPDSRGIVNYIFDKASRKESNYKGKTKIVMRTITKV